MTIWFICPKYTEGTPADLLEINHCRLGRFGVRIFRTERGLSGRGCDLAVNVMTNRPVRPGFPLSPLPRHHHRGGYSR